MDNYTVKSGDTIWSIVKEYYGSGLSNSEIAAKVQEIVDMNKDTIKDPSKISVGQQLKMCEDELAEFREETSETAEETTATKENTQTDEVSDTKEDSIEHKNAKYYAETSIREENDEPPYLASLDGVQKNTKGNNTEYLDKNGNMIAKQEYFKSQTEGPLSGMTIMVNAGHGGVNSSGILDPGAVKSGESEYEINEDYANELTEKILAQGGNVVYTQGYFKALPEIVDDFADTYGTEDNDNLKIISLHCNSASSSKASGIMYFNSDDNNNLTGILSESAEETDLNIAGTARRNTRLGEASNDNNIDNALIEMGFMTNKNDLNNLLNNPSYKEDLLNSIVDGLIESAK